MNYLEKLSDNQLINLFNGGNIELELKDKIIKEIDRRDLQLINSKRESISDQQKAFIFFTSIFLFKHHINSANKFLINNNRILYKEYWKWYTYGIGFKIILLLLLGKYILRPIS